MWSEPIGDLAARIELGKERYGRDEEIYLDAYFENRSAKSMLIQVSGSCRVLEGKIPVRLGQLEESPLYSFETLVLTHDGTVTRLRPVLSSMFQLACEYVIEPGEVYRERARLKTWAWEIEDSSSDGRENHAFAPGRYELEAIYAWAGPSPIPGSHAALDSETLSKIMSFFAGGDSSVEAFQKQKVIGQSYCLAKAIFEVDGRVWVGRIQTPKATFEIQP